MTGSEKRALNPSVIDFDFLHIIEDIPIFYKSARFPRYTGSNSAPLKYTFLETALGMFNGSQSGSYFKVSVYSSVHVLGLLRSRALFPGRRL